MHNAQFTIYSTHYQRKARSTSIAVNQRKARS